MIKMISIYDECIKASVLQTIEIFEQIIEELKKKLRSENE